jgi:hypothetical protein
MNPSDLLPKDKEMNAWLATNPSVDNKLDNPDNKDKVYAYLLALGLEAKFEKRDYLNTEAWHLNPESEALKPLFDFLNNLFQNSNN